jgi:FkbM family methyltransferase
VKKNNFINFIDIGCRYGTHLYTKKHISKIKYYGVDADDKEIKRLKKKYKSYNNIKYYNGVLGELSKDDYLNIYEHKGYISTKEPNNKSIWFGKLRKKENKIISKKKVSIIKSEIFFKKNQIPFDDILKLDVEGQELEIIKGLHNNIKKFKAIIFEGDFDESYKNASSFSTINLELSKNFFVSRIDLNKFNLSGFYTGRKTLPVSSDTVVLNKNFFNLKLVNSKYIDVLYVLNFFDLILFFLEKKPQLINNLNN